MVADTITGYVPGAWDMFHIGHLNILLRARALCDRLIVGVVTDQALFDAKGKHPMVPLAERMQILAALGIVDEVVIDQGSKLDVWHRHNFDVLFKGDDWLGTPKGDKLVADMATVGVRVHFFPYTQSTSSTRLRGIVTSREPDLGAATAQKSVDHPAGKE
ncbi:adenylyltransferase/cytidyltransferase family protein [Aestuariimicrobium kwangyangense]|uniref:adenylyltransferase/cytidyltransferase family protein n=1 Tax=Aestuariimicrobium kwangyangense TaxID=396389 RepID=UPI0003F57FA6|nr:adenylyltransferase/cytidyltransferase family protein [Aestuariimicrobium kwangyangense]